MAGTADLQVRKLSGLNSSEHRSYAILRLLFHLEIAEIMVKSGPVCNLERKILSVHQLILGLHVELASLYKNKCSAFKHELHFGHFKLWFILIRL